MTCRQYYQKASLLVLRNFIEINNITSFSLWDRLTGDVFELDMTNSTELFIIIIFIIIMMKKKLETEGDTVIKQNSFGF